jgi:hypothetical protein
VRQGVGHGEKRPAELNNSLEPKSFPGMGPGRLRYGGGVIVSPHALVAVKNQASYEQRAKQRRRDLEHVSALGG